jgi:lysophospholipase L1-like esterase
MLQYLALGDSYTIGEKVARELNFPNQAVRLLRAGGLEITDPTIIAVTGWTTDELSAAITNADLQPTYDFVSLLIGVNNQYRGRDIEQYKTEFSGLLQTAISFAGGNCSRVVVLSIPDWGVTPFAEGRDSAKIAQEIDLFNNVNRTIATEKGAHYIEITESTRNNATKEGYLAEDGLHPSDKEYEIWAKQVADIMRQLVQP